MSFSSSRQPWLISKTLLASSSDFALAKLLSTSCTFHSVFCTITLTRKWLGLETATADGDTLTTGAHQQSSHSYPDQGMLHDHRKQPQLVQANIAKELKDLRSGSRLVRTCFTVPIPAFVALQYVVYLLVGREKVQGVNSAQQHDVPDCSARVPDERGDHGVRSRS